MKPILTFDFFAPIILTIAAVGIAFLFFYGVFMLLKLRLLKFIKKTEFYKHHRRFVDAVFR